MEMNSPLEILFGFAMIGVFASAVVFMSSLTVRETIDQVFMPFVDLALQNPLFAAVIVFSVVFLILFGGEGGGSGDGD